MVGGEVVDLVLVPEGVRPEHVLVTVKDGNDTCNVLTEPVGIKVGDTLWWWQSGSCYWTPKDKRFRDKKLEKYGPSY